MTKFLILYRKLYHNLAIYLSSKIYTPLYSLPNRQVACSITSKAMFSAILNLKYTKVIFFKHQNQLCPLSILSHTSGAEFGHSWLARDKVLC